MASKNLKSLSNKNGFSEISLDNFKSVSHGQITLAPLTVILGANSAGKSSALQSLVLIAQNISRSQGHDLMLNGPTIQLGKFEEIKRRDSIGHTAISVSFRPDIMSSYVGADPQLKTKLTLEPRLNSPGIASIREIEFVFSSSTGEKCLQMQAYTDDASAQFDSEKFWQIKFEGGSFGTEPGTSYELFGINATAQDFQLVPNVYLKKQRTFEWIFNQLTRPFRHRITNDSDQAQIEEAIEAIALGEIPLFLAHEKITGTENYPEVRKQVQEALAQFKTYGNSKGLIDEIRFGYQIQKQWMRNNSMSSLSFARSRGTNLQVLAAIGELLQSTKFAEMRTFRLLPFSDRELHFLGEVVRNLQDYLKRSVHYLGPLRLEPTGLQRFETSLNPLTPVGLRGELVGYQLKYTFPSNQLSKYPLPPTSSVGGRVSLEKAISVWAEHFGLGEEFTVRELGQSGFSTEVDGQGMFQMGTGVSQFLPVLALCLSCRVGSTIILEQPELHLHPGAQQKLGEFLLLMARTGRRIIVETHSEYLVTKLRKLVAVDGMDAGDVAIVFAEKGEKGKGTTYLNSQIDSEGSLTLWPEGFFDYSTADKLEIMLSNFEDENS
jgi:hypothetical protein